MSTTLESRQVRASDRVLGPMDMICVAPPAQNFALISIIEGPAGDGTKTYAFAIYGVFAAIDEAQRWDNELSRRGFGFQTYIVPTNSPLVLPPPKDTDIECRYDDPTLQTIMAARHQRASKIDEAHAARIAEIREHEIKMRFEKLKQECLDIDEDLKLPEDLVAKRKKYRQMSDYELRQEAIRQVNALKSAAMQLELQPPEHKLIEQSASAPLTAAQLQIKSNYEQERAEAKIESKAEASNAEASEPIPDAVFRSIKTPTTAPASQTPTSMINGPLPTTQEEAQDWVRRFKEVGGHIRCSMGKPVEADRKMH